jgi:hypothetical protein
MTLPIKSLLAFWNASLAGWLADPPQRSAEFLDRVTALLLKGETHVSPQPRTPATRAIESMLH